MSNTNDDKGFPRPRKGERDRVRGSSPEFAKQLRRHQTDAERVLWMRLRNRQVHGVKFRRQHPLGNYIVDFCCVESLVIVEVDGGQHNLLRSQDQRRESALMEHGYRVLRFWNHEVCAIWIWWWSRLGKRLNDPLNPFLGLLPIRDSGLTGCEGFLSILQDGFMPCRRLQCFFMVR